MDNILFSSTLYVLFFILHAILVLVLLVLFKGRFEEDRQGAVVWVALVSCFVPILGELLGWLMWVAAKRFASDRMLVDYDEYVTYEVLNLEPVRYEARKSADIIPLRESLTMGEFSSRKNSIMQHIPTGVLHQGKYLRMGLLNEDHETVHYSATLMNTLADRYERELTQAKEQVKAYDLESIKHVDQVYVKLTQSDVLSQTVRERKEEVWLSFLLSIISLYPEEAWIYERIGDLSRRLGAPDYAIMYYEQLLESFPSHSKGYSKLIREYYEQGNWEAIRHIIQKNRQHIHIQDVPDEDRFMLRQLGGKEF